MNVAVDPVFGQRLRELRTAAGLNQSALADAVGVTRQFISQLESGQASPSWNTVRDLARALGVSVAAFDTGADQSQPAAEEPKPPKPKRKPKK